MSTGSVLGSHAPSEGEQTSGHQIISQQPLLEKSCGRTQAPCLDKEAHDSSAANDYGAESIDPCVDTYIGTECSLLLCRPCVVNYLFCVKRCTIGVLLSRSLNTLIHIQTT